MRFYVIRMGLILLAERFRRWVVRRSGTRSLARPRGLVLEGCPARRHTRCQDRSKPGCHMRDNDLFQLALGITSPWFVASSDFDGEKRRLDIRLDFKPGSRFDCPECNAHGCRVHDTVEKTWRHLDFFQHQAFLTARTPRIACTKCGVRLVTVPWARPGSGFTLLFEGFAMALAMHLPVAVAAKRFLTITDPRMWLLVFPYVQSAVMLLAPGHVPPVRIG